MKNSFGFTWYLAGLSMLGYLAMDMYLPAFGAMGEQLQIGAGAVGASLSIFLAGFALGQLLWEPKWFSTIAPNSGAKAGDSDINGMMLANTR
jgi:hypothetical protein